MTTHHIGRFFIVLVFFGLAGVSGWSASRIDQGIFYQDLFTCDQPPYKYFDFYNKYFSSEAESITVVIDNADFYLTTNQQKYKDFITHLKACTGCRSDWVFDESIF